MVDADDDAAMPIWTARQLEIRVILAMAGSLILGGAIGYAIGDQVGRNDGISLAISSYGSAPNLHTTCCDGTTGSGACWFARQNGQCYIEDKPK